MYSAAPVGKFLGKKAFALASLRDIAKAAGTSTGSIYTRFTDKAGLFRALVEPAAGELKRRFFWRFRSLFTGLTAKPSRRRWGVTLPMPRRDCLTTSMSTCRSLNCCSAGPPGRNMPLY